ncbi:MAG: nucleotide exchange factor GrpE [Opitutales bacterium]
MSEPASHPEPAPDPQTRLAELEGEVLRLRDTLLRSQADQQNQQRRHQRDREDLRKFAVSGLVEDLLPALDAFTLGLEAAAAQADGRAVAEGFRMAVVQLRTILAGHGLTELSPQGQPFDPARHEAVGQEASADTPEGLVLRVARSGWVLHDRVIRPASVFVSSGPAR